jgi:CRISPR-associated endonuclease/helicase Cas3
MSVFKYEQALQLNQTQFRRKTGVDSETFAEIEVVVHDREISKRKSVRPPVVPVGAQPLLTLEYRMYFHLGQDFLGRTAPCRCRSVKAARLLEVFVIKTVEISFPVTYRQTAGFERLVQVAGRTNRDGEGTGDVFLFDLAGGFDGTEGYRLATRHTRTLLKELMVQPESFSDAMHDPATMHRYFQDLLHDEALTLDKLDIAQDRWHLRLATVSRKFRLIDDDRVSVLVPYGPRGRKLILALRRKLSREGLMTPADRQRLQPYLVQIRPQDVPKLTLEQLHDTLYVCGAGDYDQRLGLRLYDLD